MASDTFQRAKAYRKKHPRTSWQDCVKAVSGKKKAAPKKVGAKKPTATRTVVKKTTVRKSVTRAAGIGADATDELVKVQRNIHAQETAIGSLRNKLAGATPADKKTIRADIAKRKQYVAALKKNKTVIKRFI